jgi:hypothetical protein
MIRQFIYIFGDRTENENLLTLPKFSGQGGQTKMAKNIPGSNFRSK